MKNFLFNLNRYTGLIGIVISLIGIVISCICFYLTQSANKKINAIEYEVTENFKTDLLEMVLTLNSIKSKILNDKDISTECNKLANFRMQSSYMLMWQSFKKSKDWYKFDQLLQRIIELELCTAQVDQEQKDVYVDNINELFEILFNNIDNFKAKAKFESINQIKDFIKPNIDEVD